jgi:hypothetical protein
MFMAALKSFKDGARRSSILPKMTNKTTARREKSFQSRYWEKSCPLAPLRPDTPLLVISRITRQNWALHASNYLDFS